MRIQMAVTNDPEPWMRDTGARFAHQEDTPAFTTWAPRDREHVGVPADEEDDDAELDDEDIRYFFS